MPSHTGNNANSTPIYHHKDPACLQYALFFHDLTPNVTIFAPIILAVMSCILTACIRSITPGVGDVPKPTIVAGPTPTADLEATSIPEIATDSEDPPPYQAPVEVSPTPVVPAPEMKKVKRSSAQLFVMGTSLILADITCLFLSALALQAMIFCISWGPIGMVYRVFFWLIFAMPCGFASAGASCWLMLLRDLWGPGMRKRMPISEQAIFLGVFVVLFTPFVFVGGVVGIGAVRVVEACQKKYCGDALEEEEEIVELEERLGMEELAEPAGGSGSREEERAGLMSGVEK